MAFDSAATQESFDVSLSSLRKGGLYWLYGAFHSKVNLLTAWHQASSISVSN